MSRLNKIDKLLRLHENNPEDAEADAALRKAGELMREYIDGGESPSEITDERIKALEKREEAVDKICRGCGSEKPNHVDKCLSHALEKKIHRSVVVGCGSCAGIMLLGFISILVSMLMWLFG